MCNFKKPTINEVYAYCQERKSTVNAESFVTHYDSNGWMIGGRSKMKNWKAAVRQWEIRSREREARKGNAGPWVAYGITKEEYEREG